MSARDLLSDDPYATAVRLLQAGADLIAHEADAMIADLSYEAVQNLAALADTGQTATQVVTALVNTPVDEACQRHLAGLISELLRAKPGRWAA